MPTPAAVALLGGLGALARYAIATAYPARAVAGFPWPTFAINVAGSLVLGLLAALASTHFGLPPWLRIGLTVGLLGGFTTFSTFSFETYRLVEEGAAGLALLYALGSVGAGLAAVYVGVAIGRAG